MSQQGRRPEVSDEELLNAVQTKCKLNGTPMVPTSEIEDFEGISVSGQTVVNRLKDLAKKEQLVYIRAGKNYAWGPSDNGEMVGEVDFSAINWNAVDPSEIPKEKIDKHPDVEVRTFWERRTEKASTVFWSALAVFLVGFSISWMYMESSIEVSTTVGDVGALMFIGGFMFTVLGGLGWFLGKFGKALADRGLHDLLRAGFNRLKSRIHSGIPLTISRDEGSITVSWDSSRTKEEEE